MDTLTSKELDKKFEQFGTKLFKYLDEQFAGTNRRIDEIDNKYDKLMATLDAFLKRLDDIEKDNYARDAKLARPERWAEQVAQKTGVKIEY